MTKWKFSKHARDAWISTRPKGCKSQDPDMLFVADDLSEWRLETRQKTGSPRSP